MKTSKNKRYELIIILICLCILLPLTVIGFYNRPAADDFGYSLFTFRAVQAGNGLFGVLKAALETDILYYNNWQGLYTSAFLLSLQPGIFGEEFYSLSFIILALYTYLPLLGAVHILNKHYFRNSFLFSLSLSLSLYTMLLMWLPDINDGMYWFNGAMNYTPWAFVNIFNLCLLLEIGKTDRKNKRIALIVFSTILAFITSGGNHVTAFANILLLLSALVFSVSRKKFFPAFSFAAACIGFIIMYVAPGTASRQTYFESPGAVATIIRTALHVHNLAGEWFSLKWILSLFIIIPAAIEFGHKNKDRISKLKTIHILLCAVYSVAVICGMFCVPYYAMKGFGMGRITNVVWITFNFLSWFICFLIVCRLVAAGYIDTDKIMSGKHVRKIRLAVISFGLCCMVLIFENSLACWPVKAASELVHGLPQRYAQEMDARAELYNNPELTEIKVDPIVNRSELIFHNDIGPDYLKWPNDIISAYYQKRISTK